MRFCENSSFSSENFRGKENLYTARGKILEKRKNRFLNIRNENVCENPNRDEFLEDYPRNNFVSDFITGILTMLLMIIFNFHAAILLHIFI